MLNKIKQIPLIVINQILFTSIKFLGHNDFHEIMEH